MYIEIPCLYDADKERRFPLRQRSAAPVQYVSRQRYSLHCFPRLACLDDKLSFFLRCELSRMYLVGGLFGAKGYSYLEAESSLLFGIFLTSLWQTSKCDRPLADRHQKKEAQ